MVAVPSIGRASQVTPRRAAPEADATSDLYERYARQIYAYCHHQLGNREEAEDATQSTFLNAFRGFKRGVDPEFESAWLYKIAQNVCLTRQRSSFRRRRVEAPGDLDAMQDVLPSPEADADELIGLPEALEGLPAQQRRALLLREWQGLSYKEIADELELSQSAVETLLFRARRSLAAGLGDDPALAKRVVGKLRAGSDAGSIVALLQTMLSFGGAKVAATVATVAATSVVAATPSARHAVENLVTPVDSRADAPSLRVHKVAHHAPLRTSASARDESARSDAVSAASSPVVVQLRRPAPAATRPAHRTVRATPATPGSSVVAPPLVSQPAPAPVDIAPAPDPAPPAETPQAAPPAAQPPATTTPPVVAVATETSAPPPPTVTPTSRRTDGGVDRGVPTDDQSAPLPTNVRPAWQNDSGTSGRHAGETPPAPTPTATTPPAPTAPAEPAPVPAAPHTLPPSPPSPATTSGDPAPTVPTPPPARPAQGHRH